MRHLAISLVISLVAAACGVGDAGLSGATPSTTAGNPTTTAAPPSAGPGETTTIATEARPALALASTSHGQVLVAHDGRSLYLFTNDSPGHSTCIDVCESSWPPLPAVDTVGEGLNPALLGTLERSDGFIQATYGGWPLYLFAGDTRPGDVSGQGVGGVWFLVGAGGNPATAATESDPGYEY
jgi:predicted lipoprotein with Yx(FWY)xxD motif